MARKEFVFPDAQGSASPSRPSQPTPKKKQPQHQQPKQKPTKQHQRKKQKPVKKPNEFTQRDGEYSIYATLTSGRGNFESGLIHKKKLFGALLVVDTGGREPKSIVAYYLDKERKKHPIHGIKSGRCSVEVDVDRSLISNNQFAVTVECKFGIGIFKSKVLKTTVFLNI